MKFLTIVVVAWVQVNADGLCKSSTTTSSVGSDLRGVVVPSFRCRHKLAGHLNPGLLPAKPSPQTGFPQNQPVRACDGINSQLMSNLIQGRNYTGMFLDGLDNGRAKATESRPRRLSSAPHAHSIVHMQPEFAPRSSSSIGHPLPSGHSHRAWTTLSFSCCQALQWGTRRAAWSLPKCY